MWGQCKKKKNTPKVRIGWNKHHGVLFRGYTLSITKEVKGKIEIKNSRNNNTRGSCLRRREGGFSRKTSGYRGGGTCWCRSRLREHGHTTPMPDFNNKKGETTLGNVKFGIVYLLLLHFILYFRTLRRKKK